MHKYTTQRIHFIQKCLIQHAYTKRFNYTICFKKKSIHQEFQKNTQAAAWHREKVTRTTQPEEGKERE